MVGAVNIGMDLGTFDALHEFVSDKEVVDAPAIITISRAGEKVPVGIGVFGMRMKMTV